MNFLYSLVGTLIFILLAQKYLKKRPLPFYIATIAISLAVGLVAISGLGKEDFAVPFLYSLIKLIRKGAVGFALFTWVMYAGALPKNWKLTRILYNVRGELSIMAGFFILVHNIIYGFFGKRAFFVTLFTQPASLKPNVLIAAIISLILISIMLPLLITSFRCVHRKMSAQKWKKLHRLAYVFFFLVFAHVEVLYFGAWAKKSDVILAYAVVFLLYFVLKMNKCRQKCSCHVKAK